MPQTRTTGLLLLVVGALTFLGTTNRLIPAEAFFPGLVVCLLGTVVFMKANRVAMQEGETRTQERLHPALQNMSGEALANRQAKIDGAQLEGLEAREGRVTAQAASTEQVQDDELVLYEVDQGSISLDEPRDAQPANEEGKNSAGFVVTTDVSFPLEIQDQSSLADQIAKLRRLADDGIINEDEFAIAKAKLLS